MGDGSEDVEDQLAGGGCRVDPLFEADQPDVLFLQVLARQDRARIFGRYEEQNKNIPM